MFLYGHELTKAIQRLVMEAEKLDIAVAYWGKGALEHTKLSVSDATARILCDLNSGACNPTVVDQLIKRANTEVRYLDELHAKVYLSETTAIVGSANASANGLGEEGNELNDTDEAALRVTAVSVLDDARLWFEPAWKRGIPVDKRALARARPRWDANRQRPPRNSVSDLYLLMKNRSGKLIDLPLRLIAFRDDGPSERAKKIYEEEKGKLYNASDIRRYDEEGEIPYYERNPRWRAQGQWVLEFVSDISGNYEYGGLWRVRADPPIQIEDGNALFFCDKHKNVEGLTLSEGAGLKLSNLVTDYLRGHRRDKTLDWPIAKAAQRLFPSV